MIQSDIFPVCTDFLKRKSKFKKKNRKEKKLQIYLNRFSHIFHPNLLCFLLKDNSDPAVFSKHRLLVVNTAEDMFQLVFEPNLNQGL